MHVSYKVIQFMNIIQHFKPVQSKLATVSGTLDLREKINTLRKSFPDRAYLFPLLGSVPCVSYSQRKSKVFTCHLQ